MSDRAHRHSWAGVDPTRVAGSRARRWGRRLVTIPTTFVATVSALASAPLWIPLAAAMDALGPARRCALRCGLFFTWYLLCESAGILASFAVWLGHALSRAASRESYETRNFRLQCWWAGTLYHGSARIFDFRTTVDGTDALAGGPMLLVLRHASVADTLLASVLVSEPHGIRLRYVIKRELLWDPCLDIVGHRLPNYFIRRGSEDSDREVRALRDLIRGVRPDEGVLVYPEGTRFSPAKRERILARLRERGQEGLARRAASLKNVLPPRLGGPLALLEDNPGLDVVVCAHTGFERATSFWELWNGGLRKLEVRVCFWRIPFAEIPREREERIDWLFAQWSRIDTWIDRTAGPSGSAARE